MILRHRSPFYISAFLAVLIHTAGAIGMIFYDLDSFVRLTPANLILMFLLLVWNEGSLKKEFFVLFIVGYISGVVTEIIGVNTGLLFGNYQYGNLFGNKIVGVPLVIGLNWFCIVYASYCITKQIIFPTSQQRFVIAVFTGLLATVFDFIMEPVAVELNFWQWEGGGIPVYNYISWFVISGCLAFFFERRHIQSKNLFAPILLYIQVVFFIFLRLGL